MKEERLYHLLIDWLSSFPEEFQDQIREKLEKDSDELHHQIMNDQLLIEQGHPYEVLFERLSEDF